MIQEAHLTWRYLETESMLIMPWYTKACLDWLKKQDIGLWYVFEYGAGYSTIWWRLNVENLESVDNLVLWADAMLVRCEVEKDKYISTLKSVVDELGLQDCIIVDGEWREECVEFCRPFLKPGGYLIFDNYGQEEFPPTDRIDALLEGWTKQVFRQYNHTSWATAVFQKPI